MAAYAFAALTMLGPDFRRPDFESVAGFIDGDAAPGDIVVDGANLSPAGIPTPLDATTDRPHARFYLNVGRVEYDPFRIVAAAPPPADVAREAAAAAGGRRLFVVLAQGSPTWPQVIGALAPRYRVADERSYRGIVTLEVRVFEAELDDDRRVVGRERRGAEEPALDREARVRHRRVGGGLVQEELVEEQRVAGLEERPHDRPRRRPRGRAGA